MGNTNRKATKAEMARIRRVIGEAFPDLDPVFGGRGGTVAPRERTLQFRLRDAEGKFHSNVVWLQPDELDKLTADDIRRCVKRANG